MTNWCAPAATSPTATASSTGWIRTPSTGWRPKPVCAPTSTSSARSSPIWRRIKRKSLMKQMFTQAGVPAARGTLVRTLDQAHVVRPRGRLSAWSPSPTSAWARPTPSRSAATPSWSASSPPSRRSNTSWRSSSQGDICTFDGLADKDGNPVFYHLAAIQPGRHGNRQRGLPHLLLQPARDPR